MGGFVAAVPRGAPVTAELIERVLAASRDRAPDGVRHVVTPDGVLLVQCMFANTPESVGEQLPKSDPSGRVWIVKRGHLTNIDELRGRLRDRLGADARVHTDADVMLAAYLAWGPDMAGRVDGEFTLAIWDGRRPVAVRAAGPPRPAGLLHARRCRSGTSPRRNRRRCSRSPACPTSSTRWRSSTTSRAGWSTGPGRSTRGSAARCRRRP